MRATRQEQVGGAGVSEVSAAFERLGWGVAENSRHDLGTDLFVLARDQRLFDLGLVVGVQVKTGEGGGKYFREPVRDKNGHVTGWWFRDGDRRHVDAWSSHALPHLIVLHDLNDRASYWEHVTADTVVQAGKGAKVFVPKVNMIDENHRDALLRVASSTRPGVTWERSAWIGASSLAPRDLLRHALVVPRLIAPHRNAGYGIELTPEQAVAMLVQVRLFDLERFAESHSDVPNIDEATQSVHWSWRFVGALAHRITTGDISELLQAVGDAPDSAARASATVAGAASLMEEGRVDEAIEILKMELERDESEPVDHAWLMVQHARACAEVGHLEQARTEAIAARKILISYPDDVTATAIAGVAAELLFNTSGWGQRDVKDVITGADTAASWWRTQTISGALADLADRIYKEWARDTNVVEIVGSADTVNNELLGASLTANYLGDHSEWRHLSALQARDRLLRLDRHVDRADASSALEVLRLAGDDGGLKRAVGHLAADGPAAAITVAASKLELERATRTDGSADLTLLQYGGDVLDAETASRAVKWLLSTLNDPSAFIARTTPSYLIELKLVDVLAAVVPAASAAATADVVNHVAGMPGQANQALATSWGRVVDALPDSAWTQEAVTRAEGHMDEHHSSLRLSLLRAITPLSEVAKSKLTAEARGGSMEALAELGDVRNLPPDVVSAAIHSLIHAIEKRVEDAHADRFNYGPDIGHSLALLNLWHPAYAKWDSLLTLLQDDAVPGGYKTNAFRVLAVLHERIPDDAKTRLGAIAQVVLSEPSPHADLPAPIGGDPTGAAANLATALGVLDADSMAVTLLSLLSGGHAEQRWAARSARGLGTPEGIGVLVTLAESGDANVRATAAANVASLVASGHDDPLALASLRHGIADTGTLVPATIAETIAGAPTVSSEAREVLALLRDHLSARVRRAAGRLLSQ